MATETHSTWPELAIDLYDKLTDRGSEIIYECENMEIHVPSGTQSNAPTAKWKLNGVLKIRTRDMQPTAQ